MPRKIEISHKTIIFATLFFLSLGLIFFLRDLILELFVGLLLMTILEPIVGKLSKFKIPRVISVLLTYILVLGTLSGLIALFILTVVDQTAFFITAFPSYLENIGIPYALPLAILGGILEIVPFLGPIIAAIPSILIGFGISPLTGLGVAVLTFLIHEIEGYVLVPKIMEKSTGVSPLITLISLAIGARLAGVVGAIISVPVVITLQVLTKKYLVKE